MDYFNKTGFFVYKNFKAMQNNITFASFDVFLKEQNFKNVIEIGTAYGGFCLFLYEKSIEYNYNFLSFDIVDRVGDENLKGRIILDVFSKDALDIINDKISSGKTLILCDGGDKKKEFNYFSRIINSGDFIMAHDYAINEEHFLNNIKDTYWDWCEIIDSDVLESLKNLKKYSNIDFEKCAWLCCEKK
jgi:cephalosporin hydroxylase